MMLEKHILDIDEPRIEFAPKSHVMKIGHANWKSSWPRTLDDTTSGDVWQM